MELLKRFAECLVIGAIGFGLASSGLSDPIAGRVYYLTSLANYRCLDVEHGSSDAGAKAHFWDCHKGKSQGVFFRANSYKPDMFELVFSHSQKCVDVREWKLQNGGEIHQWPCTHYDNQRFKFVKKGASYSLRTDEGLCLDVKDGEDRNGAAAQLWECTGSASQEFLLTPAQGTENQLPLLLTFQNKADDAHTGNLVSTLKRWGWDYEVVGIGSTWQGFGTKFVGYLDRLNKLEDKDRVVVLSDSTDVLINGSPEIFQKEYLRLGRHNGEYRIVSSTEKACCVDPMTYAANTPGEFILPDGRRKNRALKVAGEAFSSLAMDRWTSAMRDVKTLEGQEGNGLVFDYLNSGMMVGRAKDIITMFYYLKAATNEDDQALFTEYLLRFPDRVLLDYQNALFSNANGWEGWDSLVGCFFRWNAETKRFVNTVTSTSPTAIQTPGKYWTCYNELLGIMRSN